MKRRIYKLSSAQIRIVDLLLGNEGSCIQRKWGQEPEIICGDKILGYAKWNTVYSMAVRNMLVELKRMKNKVQAISYYKLNSKIEEQRNDWGL